MANSAVPELSQAAKEPLLSEVRGADNRRPRNLRGKVAAAAVILLLVSGAVWHTEVGELLTEFVARCAQLGWAAPVLLGVMVAVLQLLMLPTFPLMVGAGVIFTQIFGDKLGQFVGIVSVFAGMWIGSMLAFWFGRTFFREWAEEELRKYAWMHVINSMVEEQGWWVVMLARASPLLPLELFNYACALTSLSARSYAIGCLGSLVPTMVWVTSSASAATVMRHAGFDGDPEAKRRKFWGRCLFLGFNVALLAVLSVLLILAVRKYSEKAKHHVNRRLDALPLAADCSPDSVRRLSRHVTFSVHTLDRHPALHVASCFEERSRTM